MLFSKRSKKDALLKKIPVFSALSNRNLKKIEKLMDEIEVKAGKVLVHQGKPGFDFYVIADGKARVEKDGKNINSLGPGDFFGEISLIDREPRTASVISESDMTVLVVRHRSFRQLLETVPGLAVDMLVALCKYIRMAEHPSIFS
jgi:CRP/FNR family cyclic AMP-dependent transcriptional regulator